MAAAPAARKATSAITRPPRVVSRYTNVNHPTAEGRTGRKIAHS